MREPRSSSPANNLSGYGGFLKIHQELKRTPEDAQRIPLSSGSRLCSIYEAPQFYSRKDTHSI